MQLTDVRVKTFAPTAKRQEVPDDQARGLYLIVQPTGAKSFACRYSRNGRVLKTTLGPYPAVTLADARRQALQIAAAVAGGADPQGEKMAAKVAPAAPIVLTVAMVAEEFLKKHVAVNDGSRWSVEVKRYLDRNILLTLGDKAIADVAKGDIRDLIDKIADGDKSAKRDPAPIAANRTLSVTAKLFRWSLGRGYVTVDPTAGLPKPGKEKKGDRKLTDDELRAVWNAADSMPYPYGPAIKLLLLTGARRDEVGAMKWSEIDLEARTWTLPAGRSKNAKERLTPLPDAAVAILRSLPRIGSAGFVLTVTGKTAISAWSDAKERLDEKSGVKGWVVHDFRRTIATGMGDVLGVEPHVVEAVLGHIVKGVAGVYNKSAYAAQKRDALDKWAAHVDAIVGE
jgi:integrase